MKEEKLSTNIDTKNSEILTYLHKHTDYFKNFKDLDDSLGYSNGYMSRVANIFEERKLLKIHTIVLESEYKIPRTLFFNESIVYNSDIEKEIRRTKRKFDTLVENIAPESLAEFKLYKNFYILDKTSIVKRTIEIQNQNINIFNKNILNFQGFMHTSCASIIAITENPKTGNNVLFKVQRNSLIDDIIPISYMGHRTNGNEEVAGYGICSKNELNEKKIKKILEFDKGIDFANKKNKIIERIRNYR
jgi:hypothetical protein